MSKVDEIYRMKLIGACCREHRTNVLGLTLQQFQEKTGVNFKTVSNFENGRSGNAYYMFYYINLTDENEKVNFMRKLSSVVNEVLK